MALSADAKLVQKCEPIHDNEDHFVRLARNSTHTRNKARGELLKKDFTHFLWIDSDVVPPPDTVEQLLKMGTDAAGGWYPIRSGQTILPDRWVAGTFNEEGEFSNYHFPWVIKEGDPDTHPLGDMVMDIRTKKFRREPTISHLAPLGCLMLSREVMELLEFQDGTDQSCRIYGFEGTCIRGPCLQFGLQMHELGVITHMSPRVLCDHIP